MVQIARGGRAADVRLKLLLSALWLCPEPPHDTAMPARTWARLLRLSDPDSAGARRVGEAIRWLDAERFLRATWSPGGLTQITLLDECLAGGAYRSPVLDPSQGDEFDPRDRYIRLPASLWTSGWISALSGIALATLLTLLEAEPLDAATFWVSPTRASEIYGLSEGSRQRGVTELRRQRLLAVEPKSVASPDGSPRRARHSLSISHARFRGVPGTRTARAAPPQGS